MSFRYQNFINVGTPHSSTPQFYSYRTNDPLIEILATDYFDDPRATIVPGDVIYCSVTNDISYIFVATSESTVALYDSSRPITGWASYVDTNHIDLATAFDVLANADTPLANNAGFILNDEIPPDIDTFYENGVINGRLGDSLDMLTYFLAVPSATSQFIDIWLDIGGIGPRYRESKSFFKGAGVEVGVVYSLPSLYNEAAWAANGARIFVRSNHPLKIYSINYNFDRTHKAR